MATEEQNVLGTVATDEVVSHPATLPQQAEPAAATTQDASSEPESPYSPSQMYKMAAVYDFIARLIPTEGRDYAVSFSFGEGDNVSVRFDPYTYIGKIWCDYCKDMFSQAVANQKKQASS